MSRDTTNLGVILVRRHDVTPDDLARAVDEQAREDTDKRERLGQVLERQGALTHGQVEEALRDQRDLRSRSTTRRVAGTRRVLDRALEAAAAAARQVTARPERG